MKNNSLLKEKRIRKAIFKQVKKIYELRKGGERFVAGKSKVPYGGRVYDEKELISLVDAALDFWLTAGRFAQEFESSFARFLGKGQCLLTNSGSSANLLAISALTSHKLGPKRLKPGDEVITTACGFPTTLNAIIQNNLVPVFVDIDLGTYNINLERIERAISRKTRAIFIAHTLGNPAEIDKILKLAERYGLWLIEDNCDALGARYKGRFTGTFGHFATFSFYPPHHMSCSKNTPIPYLDEEGRHQVDRIERIFEKYVDKPDKIRVLSFNKNNKVEWSIPSTILRHRLESKKMVKIICQHGREVDVTEDHSIFILDRNTAEIVPKFARDIEENDYIVTTNSIPCPAKIENIDILSYFKDKNAYISNFSYSNLKYVQNADYRWQFKSRNIIPIKYLKEYYLETENLKVGICQSRKIPARVPVNEELCRLIGYFIAEGSYQNGLILSFNEKEHHLIEDIKNISSQLFNIPCSVRKIGKKAINVEIKSKNLEVLFREIFNIEAGAYKKRIPWFIYHSDKSCIYSFIYGYTKGDGSIRNKKDNTNCIDVTSVSKDLLCDFQYLLSQVGISASFYRRNIRGKRKFGKIETVGNENYSLCFSGYTYNHKSIVKQNIKDRNNISVQIPLLPKFRKYICVGKNQKIISRSRLKKYLKSNRELYSLVTGDICFLKVRSIKKVSYDANEYIYDISVPGKENFYGGFLGMFLHNTMGEGGALATKDPLLFRIAASFRDWGRDCWCATGEDDTCGKRFSQQFGKLPYGYDHKYVYSHIGYNLKVTDLQAAIGVAQLKKLPGFIKARQKNFSLLYSHLKQYEQYFILPRASQESRPSWFGFPLAVKEDAGFTRDEIVKHLEKNRIATRMLFGGNLIKHPAYQNTKYKIFGSLENTDFVMNNLFWIGVYPGLTKSMLKFIFKTFDQFLKK